MLNEAGQIVPDDFKEEFDFSKNNDGGEKEQLKQGGCFADNLNAMVDCAINGWPTTKQKIEQAGIGVEDFKIFLKAKLEEKNDLTERAGVFERMMKLVHGSESEINFLKEEIGAYIKGQKEIGDVKKEAKIEVFVLDGSDLDSDSLLG